MSQEKPNETPGAVSGFFGAIRGVLFEDDPKTKPVVKPAQPAAPVVAGGSAPSVASSAAPAAANPMVANMMALVMDKTTAYTALVDAITPLEQFIPDEGARFKAAYSIVGKTRSIEQIIQAIDLQHLQILETEVQRFNSQARNQETNEVTSRQREIESLQQSIHSSNEEADRLRKQTEARLAELAAASSEATQKIAQKEREIAEKNAAIAQINSQFTQAVETVKGALLDAKAKVLRHLGA